MEIILQAVFGLDPGERLDAVRQRLSAMLAFGDRPISLLPRRRGAQAVLERHGPFAGFLRLQEEADELLFELIDERRREGAERDDILSLLLDARHEDESPMSAQELRDELMTLLVAGHETTASTLSWTFERLVRLPDVMTRLTDEVAGPDGDVHHRDGAGGAAAKAGAAQLGPAPGQAADRGRGWSYPVDVCLVPNAYLLHHDPEIYADPTRSGPSASSTRGPAPTPGSGGRRRCIGASFAMLEMKIVIRSVLENQVMAPVAARAERQAPQHHDHPRGGSRVTLSAPQRAGRLPELMAA